MRKCKIVKRMIVVVVVLCLAFSSNSTAFANQIINVTINGRVLLMDTQPVVREGRILVPFRAIFNALEATVVWNAATKTITGIKGERVVVLQIDSPVAKIGNDTVIIDVPPTLISDRTMVPIRFIAGSLGADVRWDGQTRTVIITYTPTSIINQSLSVTHPNVARRYRMSSREVTIRVQPAVVSIETHRAQGSGFFVSADGLILTNAHVVRGSRQITVITHARERFSAEIVKIANHSDLALLRINVHSQIRFPFLKDNPDVGDIQQGEEVLAFGSPLGLVGTVTRGIVSAWREKDVTFGGWIDNYIWLIQHDAAIAPGNSGGPLVNMYGEWVGVNTLGRDDWAGFNFAVPSEEYHHLLQQDNFCLRCDYFSYHTENWKWSQIEREAGNLIQQAHESRSTERAIVLLEQGLSLLNTIQKAASIYQPIYTEIQNLNHLYVNMLNARLSFWSYQLNVRKSLVQWSETTSQILLNNGISARNAYGSARRELSDRFR